MASFHHDADDDGPFVGPNTSPQSDAWGHDDTIPVAPDPRVAATKNLLTSSRRGPLSVGSPWEHFVNLRRVIQAGRQPPSRPRR
jgi:hypothetical protein